MKKGLFLLSAAAFLTVGIANPINYNFQNQNFIAAHAIEDSEYVPINSASVNGVSNFADNVTVNEKDAYKVGTGSSSGSFSFSVPKNTTKLRMYVAQWNKDTGDLEVSLSVGTVVGESTISGLSSDSSISGTSTDFTLNRAESTYLVEISLTGVTSACTVTLASTAKRLLFWDIKYYANLSSLDKFSGLETKSSLKFGYTTSSHTETLPADYKFTKVTETSQLKAGDKILIVASGYGTAMSTTQNSNNRGEESITIAPDGEIKSTKFSENVEQITLEAGSANGSFALNTSSGYLCAASSSSNNLKSKDNVDGNSSWAIVFSDTGTATLTAQGSYSRKVMQYNATSKIFACYSSASQKPLEIYKRIDIAGGETEITDYLFTSVGIRFGSVFNTDIYTGIANDNPTATIEYGVAVCSGATWTDANAVCLPSTNVYSDSNGNTQFFSSLNGIPNASWSLVISAKLYVKINSTTTYVETTPASYSVKSLAQDYLDNHASDPLVAANIGPLSELAK